MGILESLGVVAVLAAALAAFGWSVGAAHPSAEVFRDLQDVSVGIVLAFVIATAGVRIRVGDELRAHVNWLGITSGLGLAGFVAIGLTVALASYREAGNTGLVDVIGLCWIASALLVIGCLVAILPYALYQWNRPLDQRD